LAACALLAAVTYGLWPDRRPNLLWITVDGLRPDRLPAYGYAAGVTPAIDYLARHGVAFNAAFTDAPWTTASVASAMTGRFGIHHGLRTRFSRLPEGETTLAVILRAGGYDTAAIVGSFALDHVYGLDRGFAVYDDHYDSPLMDLGERVALPSAWHADADAQRTYLLRKSRADSIRSDAAVGDAAVAWLRRASRMKPYFLWVHFFGAATRQIGGEDGAATAARVLSGYDSNVATLDVEISRILDELRQRDELQRTIVVLQGTYGEGLMQHDELDHGTALYDSVLRVPVIVSWPGRYTGRRVTETVRTVDLTPTLLELVGIATPAGVDGRSVAPALRGESVSSPPLVAETWYPAEGSIVLFNPEKKRPPGLWKRAVRNERWKYMRADPHLFIDFSQPRPLPADAESYRSEQLFDLTADPGETRNVAAEHPEVVETLRRRVESFPPLPPPAASREN